MRPGAVSKVHGERRQADGRPRTISQREDAMTRSMTQAQSRSGGQHHEAMRHTEGPVARSIEEYTAQLPSDTFLWAAGASIATSLTLMTLGNRHGALFVGQWAPTFLLLGIYNKIVKVAGSDRVHRS